MKIRLLVVAGKNREIADLALDVACRVFPDTTAANLESVNEALDGVAGPDPEILVLADPRPGEIEAAGGALDRLGLSRWAVVARSEAERSARAEVVPPAEWNPSVLSRALRSALSLHLLRRENEQLRNDLLSVGVRVVHDLRGPLGGVWSGVDAIIDFLASKAPEGLALTQAITVSADDLVRIIGQLSLWAKATARPAPAVPFDMGVAVSRAMESLERKAQLVGASVSRPDSWPTVRGDAANAEAVWRGLVENALRHAGDKPSIELGWSKENSGFRFWVRDNGRGVDPSRQAMMFQPFNQLHEPNAMRGLGLPIMERLIQLQGGTCGFEPVASGGACFFFSLPAED